MLILVSTVFGAISGVGIWFVIGLVHPAATSALIHTFVWGWAIEWAFFLLEVITALAWYATWDRVRPRTHFLLIVLYAFAAYMSLVIIQGILGFMLTPGRWLETRGFWDGFFNPTYLPGLLFRTGVCLLLAGTYLTLAALREKEREARGRLVRFLARIEVAGVLLATVGLFAWKGALPEDVKAIFLGAKPSSPRWRPGGGTSSSPSRPRRSSPSSRPLFPRAVRWPQAVLALVAAFGLLGGYERVREGARKPFVIRNYMFSNGVLVSEIPRLEQGRHPLEGAVGRPRRRAGPDLARARGLPGRVRLVPHAGRIPLDPEEDGRRRRRFPDALPDFPARRRGEVDGEAPRKAGLSLHAPLRRDRRGAARRSSPISTP